MSTIQHKGVLLLVCLIICVAQTYAVWCEDENCLDPNCDNTYDYIVVGMGQAGCATAARLAEKYKVLGIEWGDRTHRDLGGRDYVAADLGYDENGDLDIRTPLTRFDVPSMFASISSTIAPGNPALAPYPSLTGYLNNVLAGLFLGKMLGGSGAHNGLLYMRHQKETVDSWGVPGWSWQDMVNFYNKIENCTACDGVNPAAHGYSGPLRLTYPPTNTSQFLAAYPVLLQACQAMGYPYDNDFNDDRRYGCGRLLTSVSAEGLRSDTAIGYLVNALKSNNLTISLKSRAIQILIRAGVGYHADPVAYGVKYVQANQTRKVFARKEVIITLSAILTPKILLLSGIGPAADLQKLGIKVWVDNSNVGKNLHSNPTALGSYSYPTAPYGNVFKTSEYANQYAFNRTGPWSYAPILCYAYMCSDQPESNCTNPNVMIGTVIPQFGGINDKAILNQIAVVRPQSRGQIQLISANPFDCLNITYNAYAKQYDLDAAIWAWRKMRQWMNTAPAPTIIGQEISPGLQLQTDAELATFVKRGLSAHWGGSCKFGNPGDTTRVVDPKLKVVGIKNLRVCDGSIFPDVNSHMQASAALAGERCADFILTGN